MPQGYNQEQRARIVERLRGLIGTDKQTVWATRLGIDAGHLSSILRNKKGPGPSLVASVAEHLGVTQDEVINGDPPTVGPRSAQWHGLPFEVDPIDREQPESKMRVITIALEEGVPHSVLKNLLKERNYTDDGQDLGFEHWMSRLLSLAEEHRRISRGLEAIRQGQPIPAHLTDVGPPLDAPEPKRKARRKKSS